MVAAKNALGPYQALYRAFIHQARRANREVELTYEDFVLYTNQSTCHYCGDDIYWATQKKRGIPCGYNLDRKDSSLGYLKSNCVVCCPRCNRSKSDSFSYEEWLAIGATIRIFRERRAWR